MWPFISLNVLSGKCGMALMLMTKKAVPEICFGKKIKEFVAGTFKNICTVVVHC